jgi:signal peptidase II
MAFVLDQATKLIVRHSMELHQSIPIMGEIVKLTYVRNPGIAFGIRVQNGVIFTVLSILASLGVAVYLFTHLDEGKGVKISLSLILGGAFGNLIDRILYKEVVDFIDIGIGNLRWPVFNLADSFVVIGMIILFYSFFFTKNELEKEQQHIDQAV